MVRTEHYKIMPCYEHFTVYYQGIFLSNCGTIHESEQEITEHIEQNTGRRTEQHEQEGEQNSMSEFKGILIDSELKKQITTITEYEQASDLIYLPFYY